MSSFILAAACAAILVVTANVIIFYAAGQVREARARWYRCGPKPSLLLVVVLSQGATAEIASASDQAFCRSVAASSMESPSAQTDHVHSPQASEFPLPPGHLYPNGIARAADGTLFIGLVTSGAILRRGADGRWSVFVEGSETIYAATSLRLDHDRGLLWGTSPDFLPGSRARPHRVFARDSRSGEVRQVLTVPDGGFGNDLAIEPDGGILVTDSRKGRVLRLPPNSNRFEIVVEHPDLAHASGIGAAGIARHADGRLIIGNFGSGRFFVLERTTDTAPNLRAILTPRLLENPDGLAFAPDGALLIAEGAVQTGDGKLVRIPDPFGLGERRLEVLRAGLPSPLNLTVAPDGVAFVTISRIRHRLTPGMEDEVPDEFSVLMVELCR